MALLEFIPVEDIKETIFEFFGIELDENTAEDKDTEIVQDIEKQDESFFDKFYVFVFIAAGIIFAIVILILLRLLAMACP